MADWTTISSLATAGGTLVLAVATFSSVKSANRSARIAELSLMAGLRPLLIPSREEDPPQRIGCGDGVIVRVPGHGGSAELRDDKLYMAIALRNGGQGLAVLHGWRLDVPNMTAPERSPVGILERPSPEEFRRQNRDLFIPTGEIGFWQGAIRDTGDRDYEPVRAAIEGGERVIIDLLYGDHEGGQRAIARFGVSPWPEIDGERAELLRHFNVDRDDPR
jgi:hypothetical protein